MAFPEVFDALKDVGRTNITINVKVFRPNMYINQQDAHNSCG